MNRRFFKKPEPAHPDYVLDAKDGCVTVGFVNHHGGSPSVPEAYRGPGPHSIPLAELLKLMRMFDVCFFHRPQSFLIDLWLDTPGGKMRQR